MQIHNQLAGRYRLTVRNTAGQVTRDTGWFDNLITDRGLDLLGEPGHLTGSTLGACCVGSSNSTPAVSDTALGQQIAIKNTDAVNFFIVPAERYVYWRTYVVFDRGAAAGNISEVGVGKDAANLFSRALIRDQEGNPTTITVLADEYLTVYYYLRLLQPTVDIPWSADGYSGVIRSARASAWSSGNFDLYPNETSLTNSGIGDDIDDAPRDTYAPDRVENDTYQAGSHQITGRVIYSLGEANDNNLNAGRLHIGPGYYQFSINPPIAKTSSQELTIDVGLSWGREGEL